MPLRPDEQAIEDLLSFFKIKCIPGREASDLKPHLHTTHIRVAKMYRELLSGYETDPKTLLKTTFDETKYDQIVAINNIKFFSLCAHHMIPFFGTVSLAYLPQGQVVGLSKFPRLVKAFARRLQIQEMMTQKIGDAIMTHVGGCKGAGVVIKARHLCVEMRGIESPETVTTTSVMLGCFRDEAETRAEVLTLLGR